MTKRDLLDCLQGLPDHADVFIEVWVDDPDPAGHGQLETRPVEGSRVGLRGLVLVASDLEAKYAR